MDIKTLRTELEGIKGQATAILDAYKETAIPAEKKAELDALMTKMAEVRGQIETEQDLEQKRRDLADATRWLEDPQHKIPHGAANGGDDAKDSLLKAGWERKGGYIFAPTSFKGGEPVLMYPEDVLFGEIPTDEPEAANYIRKTRASFTPEYSSAFRKFIQYSVKYRSEAMALSQLSSLEQKALSEGTDTAGGALVPPDMQAELLVRRSQMAVIRQRATVRPTSRDVLKWPMVQAAASPNGSIYSSGFIGSWAGETPAFSDTDPAFGTFEVPVKKIRCVTKLSNDFVNDSAADILGFIAQEGAKNMALTEDSGFTVGDGSPLQPRGLLNCGFAEVDVEGSVANTISNSTTATGSAPKLIDLEYALPSQYAQGAVFLMRRAIEGKIRKLVDAQGRFLWPVLSGSAFGGVARNIDGYDVLNSEFMPADGTDANKVLFYGDLANYIIADRTQTTLVVLRERFADTDQIGIVLFERVGGDAWNVDSARIGIV